MPPYDVTLLLGGRIFNVLLENPWAPPLLLTAQLHQNYWGCANLCHSRIRHNVRTNSFHGSSLCEGFSPRDQQQILKTKLEG